MQRNNEAEVTLAQRLRAAREAAGLSVAQVADGLWLNHRQSISYIEHGKRRVQALELVELCNLYGVTVTEMLEGLDVPKRKARGGGAA
jgi:transcriptional regulator with XRE-family HTH domain